MQTNFPLCLRSCDLGQSVCPTIGVLEECPNQVFHFLGFVVQRQRALAVRPLFGDVRHRCVQHHLELIEFDPVLDQHGYLEFVLGKGQFDLKLVVHFEKKKSASHLIYLENRRRPCYNVFQNLNQSGRNSRWNIIDNQNASNHFGAEIIQYAGHCLIVDHFGQNGLPHVLQQIELAQTLSYDLVGLWIQFGCGLGYVWNQY